MPRISNLLKFELLLLVISSFYYLFFANKGLVFFDEGIFTHSAERIWQGQLPYKDFWLQYGPTYSYILAFLYKIFGPTILIGRLLSVFICLLIIACTFIILNKLKSASYKIVFLSFLSLVSFGYPLINIPNIMWMNVLLALLLIITYLYREKPKKFATVFIMGILLALSLSCKQNLGAIYILVFNLLFLLEKEYSFRKKAINLFILNLTWAVGTFAWIYFFFLRQDPQTFFGFINFSKNFAIQNAFTYPSLIMILKPLGLFKLLPYYLPVGLFFIVLYFIFRKNKNINTLLLPLVSVTGFFVTVFPQSDLLHCYPFFGLVLISLLILFPKSKLNLLIVFITILVGFYLTFFTKSYRYERYFWEMDTYLNLPRTQLIMVSKNDAASIMEVANFINKNTNKGDYIFAYPNASLLYFILERQNPSKDQIYYLKSWHFYDDKTILSEIKNKKVKYIITHRAYTFGSDLSYFIQKQKQILSSGEFRIFKTAD